MIIEGIGRTIVVGVLGEASWFLGGIIGAKASGWMGEG